MSADQIIVTVSISMRHRLIAMGGSVGWNSMNGRWSASAPGPMYPDRPVRSNFFGYGDTPEAAVEECFEAWKRAGSAPPQRDSEEEMAAVKLWCEQRDRDRELGEQSRLQQLALDTANELERARR